jgi:PIN domain nuclease of toxin-antitoxin system
MERDDAVLWISAASVWEMAIKVGLGRLQLPSTVEDYIIEKIAEGYQVMPVTWSHAAAVERLPLHHRDPFDRLLAAQALAERCSLVTRDRVFRKYGVEVIW